MVKVREEQPLLPDGSIDLDAWIKRIVKQRSDDDEQQVRAAISSIHHSEFFQLGLSNADILADLGMDTNSLVAGLLYPAWRHGALKNATLTSEVQKLCDGVSAMDTVHQRNPLQLNKDISLAQENLFNFRKMLLAVVTDVRVVLIKLAMQLSDMRLAVKASEEIKQKLALEATEIYAPLANRLGVGQIKWELEDFAFRFAQPEIYKNIAKLLDERRLDRDRYINQITKQLSDALHTQNIKAEINGRAKHIYSIWRKMQRKMVGYGEIYDVRAVRVVVENLTDCYAALGLVHTLWQHIPKEFDDYIANPKDNGYQSLHTAVLGPGGKIIEVQVRTRAMHQQAELGVAAHWRYKEGAQHEPFYEKQLNQLRQVLNWQEQDEANLDQETVQALEAMRAEFFADRVYVFTPQGDVIDLPVGATPIDFAYHIHSAIGDRCRGAKINGKMVPLNQALNSGDQVEILTTKDGGPSRDWLNPHLQYTVTSKARNKISLWFKQQNRDQNIHDGRDLLLRELKRLGFANISIKEIAKHVATCQSEEDLLAGLGNGDIKISQAVGALQRMKHPSQTLTHLKPHHEPTTKKKTSDIIIAGVDNLVSHMARCCKPIPGDDIIGYLTLGEGVAIHRKDCINILHVREDKKARLISVEWGNKTENRYGINITIKAYNRRGLLRDITAVIAAEHVDVNSMQTSTDKDANLAEFHISAEIPGLEELGRVLTKIQQIPNIIDVYRD